MLEVKNLRAKVEGREVLKGVNISLEPGNIVVLTGPNGSGKSTLARAIMGDPRVEILEGSVVLDGEEITDLPPEGRFKKGIFLSFQTPPEFEGIKIGEFLLRVSGKSGESAVKELKELVKRVGLTEDFLYRELHKGLSGGERKRIELLQALFLDPRYIVFDEIDSGVDVESVEQFIKIVKEMANEGKGILYITHNPLSLELLKDYPILRMEGGKIIENGRKD